MEKNKSNRITELQDSDFLSFLYSERDREEGLVTYQGWNLWAIAGAMVTVIWTLYSILCKHHAEIDALNVGYILSGMLSFILCYLPWGEFGRDLFVRERGVDINKLRYLKEITPKIYLRTALFCSVVFTAYFLLFDDIKPWNVVTVFWIVSALLFIFGNVSAYRNRNKIVSSVFDVLVFTKLRWNVYFMTAIGCVLSVVWVGSFRRGYGGVFNSPDFEVAICIIACLLLSRLYFHINSELRKSSNIDKILDDYLYKGLTKENAYYQMQVSRMGRGVLASCGKEMMEVKASYDAFEPHKAKMEELITQFDKGEVNAELIYNYFYWVKQATAYAKACSRHARSLDDRLKQIAAQVPALSDTEEYKNLFLMVDALLDRAIEMIDVTRAASDKMDVWHNDNVCKKYGGVCYIKECSHRHDKPLLLLRIKMMCFRISTYLFGLKLGGIKILERTESKACMEQALMEETADERE